MNNPLDIIGYIYSDMEVISYEGKTANHVKLYKVKCIICGNKKIIQYARLNSSVSCCHTNKFCEKYIKSYDENIGMIVNDYKIIRLDAITKQGYRYIAKCNICGIEFSTYISNFKREFGTKHSECSFHLENDEYLKRFRKIYSCMIQRTTNPKSMDWENYGGRGIKSDAFKDFIIFYNCMFESYKEHIKMFGEKDTTIDRVDVNGNYEPSNCRWATIDQQANNKRTSRIFEYNGRILSIAQWCRFLNINYQMVMSRINNSGWSIGKALELI